MLMTDEKLLNSIKSEAVRAAENAYAPYSGFRVGAAAACGGRIFTGTNVENRSYGLTVCAERNAVSAAVNAGCREITAIAVYCMDAGTAVPPCGACRQVLAEFAAPEVSVFFAGKDKVFRSLTIKELYPEDSLHDLRKY